MPNLLISKINDIDVIQIGDSEVTISNRSQRIEKPKKPKETKKEKSGLEVAIENLNKARAKSTIAELSTQSKLSNKKKITKAPEKVIVDKGKSLDLGAYQDSYSTRVFCVDQSDNNELIRSFSQDPEVIITDKHKGKLTVFITNVRIVDSDTHVGRAIFNISCLIQSKGKELPFNYESALDNNRLSMFQDLKDKIDAMSETALRWIDEDGVLQTPSTFVKGYLTYVDDAVDIVRAGTILALNAKVELLKSYRSIRYRIDTTNQIIDTLAGIVQSPIQFYDLLHDILYEVKDLFINFATFIVPKRKKRKKLPIYEAKINNQLVSQVDQTLLSDNEKKDIEHQLTGIHIVNNFISIDSLNDLLNGDFDTQDEFEELVKDLLLRIHYSGYDNEFIIDLTYNIEAFANTQKYRRVITKTIDNPTPLLRIIYEEYGNLDDYEFIKDLNNFKDNDYIEGDLKILTKV